MMKILKLQEKSLWPSIETIMPHLNALWNSDGDRYQLLTCDVLDHKELIKMILQCDRILVLLMGPKVCKALKFFQDSIGELPPLMIYLYGDVSIAFAHYHSWRADAFLTSHDLFIASSTGDLKCADLSYQNLNITYSPFPVSFDKKISLPSPGLNASLKGKNFIYCGRITAQKNLHTLILAFSLMKKSNHDFAFHIFGNEDNFGSPFTGLEERGYKDFIVDLIAKYKLSENVFIHEKTNREVIYNFFKSNDFFYLSATLQSDENFGLAPFEFLNQSSNNLVLSHWGGHIDHKNAYPERCFCFNVYRSMIGPVVHINEIYEQIKRATNEIPHDKFQKSIVKSPDEIISIQDKVVATQKRERVISTSLRERIIEQKQQFQKEGGKNLKLFSSYSDPLWQPLFHCYGAKEIETSFKKAIKEKVINQLQALPWVFYNGEDEKIVVNDPHKGIVEIPFGKSSKMLNIFFESESIMMNLDIDTAEKLFCCGYLYYEES